METNGMTDMQFKSWIRGIVRELEKAETTNDINEKDEIIGNILKDLKEDIQG